MRQSIQQRLYGVVYQAIKEASLGAQFECDVSAGYAPVLSNEGAIMGFEHSWLVTVSTPNPIVGKPAIAASVPFQGVVPPDDMFVKVAQGLWRRVAAAKDEVLTKPAAIGMDLSGIGK